MRARAQVFTDDAAIGNIGGVMTAHSIIPMALIWFASACAEPPTSQNVLMPPHPGTDATSLELGRVYTIWLHGGAADLLWPYLSVEMRAAFGDIDGLRAFQRQLAPAGAETSLVEERVTPWLSEAIYDRVASHEHFDRPILTEWKLTADGRATAVFVVPRAVEAATAYGNYQTVAQLRLPFSRDGLVAWGGRDAIDNYHAVAADQRFAIDVLGVRDGVTRTGDGRRNDQYVCFGQPVLAPAAGRVVRVENGIEDNVPGIMNPAKPLGNHVIIEHSAREFSFLAHLQRGTVLVVSGDLVGGGAEIGRCGNSGNSSEPHLHYHLQTTADFGSGDGLPAQFTDYVANGQPVNRDEPRRGQLLRR